MLNQIILHGSQRIDKPDFDTIFQYIKQEHQANLKKLIGEDGFIVAGFLFTASSINLEIYLDRTVPRVAIGEDGTLFVDDSISSVPLTLTMEDNATNYVEFEIIEIETDEQTRPFWDIGQQKEYTDDVVTKKTLNTTTSIFSNTTGFTAGRIPLYEVTTSSGLITGINRVANDLFAPSVRSYANVFGSPRSDLSLGNQNKFNDGVALQLKDVIGTTNWYDSPLFSLKDCYDIFASPVYREEFPVLIDIIPDPGTGLTVEVVLPLDSKQSDEPEYYIIGSDTLLVELNGRLLVKDIDYIEYSNGGHGTDGTGVKFKRHIYGGLHPDGDYKTVITFRKVGGSAVVETYLPSQIAVKDEGSLLSSEIQSLNFTGGQIVASINPTISNQVDVTVLDSSSSGAVQTKINGTTGTLPAFTPVYLRKSGLSAGRIFPCDITDNTDEEKWVLYGITLEEITAGASGNVQTFGRVIGGAYGRGWSVAGRIFLGATEGTLVEKDSVPSEGVYQVGLIDNNDIIIARQDYMDIL